jgi:protein gp37
MSEFTSIEWCDSTTNPAMGCDGCELFPRNPQIAAAVARVLIEKGYPGHAGRKQDVRRLFPSQTASDTYHARHTIAATIAGWLPNPERTERRTVEQLVERAITAEFKCYAGALHLWRGANDAKPEKRSNPGYAPKFEIVTKYPGRMRAAAAWSDLRGTRRLPRQVGGKERPARPWLDGLPRLIFISDMADLLSAAVDFNYIRDEVIENVTSDNGRRHIWLWLTKRPARMAKFSEWLLKEGISWPDNLVAMTSVTSGKTVGRVDQLRKVRCRFRGLSVEPLWEQVSLSLVGIDWVIAGGESALRKADASPFDLAWARDLRRQCHKAKVAYFLKQLGTSPVDGGADLLLEDHHGGDWDEWPAELRVREFPKPFRKLR